MFLHGKLRIRHAITNNKGHKSEQNLRQELDKVSGLDEGDEGGELWVEGEEVEDGARLPCARVQWHRKVEGSPAHHGQFACTVKASTGECFC